MDSRMEFHTQNGDLERMRVRVSLILCFIDDYTDKRITSLAMQVCLKGARKPILKKEGYYIFTSLSEEVVFLSVLAYGYQRMERELDLRKIKGREPLVKIRLQPGVGYPFLDKMMVLSGKTETYVSLQAVSFQSRRFCRLINDYKIEDGNRIRIFYSDRADLEGKRFAVWQRDSLEYEIITICEVEDSKQGVFVMEKELQREYFKGVTRLLPVYSGQADEQGNFFLVMGDLEGKEVEVQVEILRKNGEKRRTAKKICVGKEGQERWDL